MPLESATFISDLVSANPAPTDGLAEADDHLRLIKAALKSTFPNIAAAVTVTHTDLNKVPTNVTDIAALKTGKADLTGATFTGDLIAHNFNADTGKLKEAGNPLIPQGIICLWSGLATAVPAGWTLCNGVTVSGVTPPDLRDRFLVGAGGAYGVGATGGLATAAGTTGAAGSHSHTATTDSQGSHAHSGNTQGHALTVAEMPSHNHTISNVNFNTGGSGGNGVFNGPANVVSTDYNGGNQAHTHGLSADGLHAHNIGINGSPDHTHTFTADNRPPFYALAYIMKL